MHDDPCRAILFVEGHHGRGPTQEALAGEAGVTVSFSAFVKQT